MGELFREVRSQQNLFSAWRHVKRSALNSINNEIRGQASEFEYQHQRHLQRIARQLREQRFQFGKAKGVLKDKKKRESEGKDPRPIAISPLENRIVQRAILQVLQPRVPFNTSDINSDYRPKIDNRLGKINLINHSKYGVGGLLKPYGGVPSAIQRIRASIDNGYQYYYRSDIKSFFTKIPTSSIVEIVLNETGDQDLVDIFSRALEVQLQNVDELRGYTSLFPSDGIGVAQGSSLSAFAGNALLFDFDHRLNKLPVTSVRYIDDLIIVARNNSDLQDAIKFSNTFLGRHGLSLYDPKHGSQKAAVGRCVDAVHFLGCTIQPNRCVPSSKSIQRFKSEVQRIISLSKNGTKMYIDHGKCFQLQYSMSATIQRIGKMTFGWQKAFSFCTDSQQFRLLDADIAKKVSDYDQHMRRVTKSLDTARRVQIFGIPSMEQLFKDNHHVS